MKAHFTSVIFGLLFGLISLNASADTFYVTQDTPFKLKPGGDLTGLTRFLWTSTVGGLGDLSGSIDAEGILTQTLDLTADNTVRMVKYSFQSGTASCLSNLVEHTVYVLPKLVMTVDGLVGDRL